MQLILKRPADSEEYKNCIQGEDFSKCAVTDCERGHFMLKWL